MGYIRVITHLLTFLPTSWDIQVLWFDAFVRCKTIDWNMRNELTELSARYERWIHRAFIFLPPTEPCESKENRRLPGHGVPKKHANKKTYFEEQWHVSRRLEPHLAPTEQHQFLGVVVFFVSSRHQRQPPGPNNRNQRRTTVFQPCRRSKRLNFQWTKWISSSRNGWVSWWHGFKLSRGDGGGQTDSARKKQWTWKL